MLEKCAEEWKENILEIEKQAKNYELDKKNIILELSYEDFCATPEEYIHRFATFPKLDPYKFRIKDFSEIKNMNYEYKENLNATTIEKLTNIMQPALHIKGYII